MSDVQRWMVCTSFTRGQGYGEMLADDDGQYYLCSDVDPLLNRVCRVTVDEDGTSEGSCGGYPNTTDNYCSKCGGKVEDA